MLRVYSVTFLYNTWNLVITRTAMKITLLYQVSHYIRVKKQRNVKTWDQQNYLVIRGFCYISNLFITRFHCNHNVEAFSNDDSLKSQCIILVHTACPLQYYLRSGAYDLTRLLTNRLLLSFTRWPNNFHR